MFQKLKNLDAAFRATRIMAIMVIICCLLLCGFVIYRSYRLAAITQSKIYVLVNGKALEALAGERNGNIPVEAKDHIKTFHHYFFTLDPDEKVIQTNITKSLYLADGSVKQEYENLKESGYYSNIISGNISQSIYVDSVYINTDVYPYFFRCYGTQKIIRTTSTVQRSLITEGFLRTISRSDNNPHGFLIEKWAITENRDLKVENR